MTNKQRTMLFNYARAPFGETIYSLYRKPSSAKVTAYNNCVREAIEKSQEPNTLVAYKAIKGNCDFFSFAYFYMTINPETGEVNFRLNYKTGKHVYDFDVTEEVNQLTADYCRSRLGIN